MADSFADAAGVFVLDDIGGIGEQIATMLGLSPLPEGAVEPLPKSKPRGAIRKRLPPGGG